MNNFITYSGWLISLVSIFVSLLLYYRGKAQKRLELRQVSVSSIGFPTNSDEYKIQLLGKNVGHTLTRAHFKLRNRGNAGIEKSDIRTDAKVEFDVSEGELLGAYIAARGSEEPPSTIKIEASGNSIVMTWDYIDPKEEFQIVAYFSGAYKGAKLKGHFKNGMAIANTILGSPNQLVSLVIFISIFILYPVACSTLSIWLENQTFFRGWVSPARNLLSLKVSASLCGSLGVLLLGAVVLFGSAGATRAYPVIKRWISSSTPS
ncbi:MAG TPA: hypothetical protein VHY34_03855 [Caulobacteraceae bacterium]|nr:hypothetical protein [Caulobacteraceae bacterium]